MKRTEALLMSEMTSADTREPTNFANDEAERHALVERSSRHQLWLHILLLSALLSLLVYMILVAFHG